MAEDGGGRAMFDWATNAPPAELAAELLAAFGPHGAKGGGNLDDEALVDWLFRGYYPNPGYRERMQLMQYARELRGPVREALQLLEHAELVYVARTEASPTWSTTRLGLATLASGKAMVRQRIRDRTGA